MDLKGRPLKLMKCAFLRAAAARSRQSDEKSPAGPAVLGNDDESLAAELADGYTVVRPLTPAALDLESTT
ncbi:MAG: hypothetical protein EOQ86_20345 [Mesorhizobium sp.]|uniref:hypothetical protein n=1 Tax=Mesorhizobium sp. TaxID=1871066 RepID=UPI000FE50943|nr:hypothetical protein [Mesorhizobium sp.]RWH76590.1 MAG: hypothetical protein EOQ85_21805 [Mesorhizobium sp.]RWH79897.1 MAG: hypothetical protein EOQ86_20345 [Mesorhizobium sp.]RWH89051.1 MAG: hypothetical protein EOQ87_17280 [Mesorhizobium sp.]RWI01756.1 MAG: hypothetical protein EOQ88_05005 [Mesorhizobium sp.]RWI03482.1 MAG: hypothetical protein EOQ89_12795 [Mesorhizobium sp.]